MAAKHGHTACGQLAIRMLQCTAALKVGSGWCRCYTALQHRLGALCFGTAVIHRHTA